MLSPRRNIKLALTPTLRNYFPETGLKSSLNSVSPILSPSQLESRERLRILNSPKPPSRVRFNFLEFKKQAKIKISEKLESKLKTVDSYGIFPKELNELRQETLKEVTLHREYSIIRLKIFKKQAVLSPRFREEKKSFSPDCFNEEKNKKKVLEKLQKKITHRPKNLNDFQPENLEQKTLADMQNFISWLNEDGRKKYQTGNVQALKLWNKKI